VVREDQANNFIESVSTFVYEKMKEMKLDPVEITIDINCSVQTSIQKTIEKDPRE
jgi:hypothetical protein